MNELIAEYQARVDVLREEIEEVNEYLGDDFNPCDASGGNFDDAYYLGEEHGELFEEYRVLKSVIKDLKALKEDGE